MSGARQAGLAGDWPAAEVDSGVLPGPVPALQAEPTRAALSNLSLFLALGSALRGASDAGEALASALRLLDRHLGVKRAAVHFLDRGTGDLRVVTSYGLSSEHWALRPGRGVAAAVALSGRARFVRRVDAEPEAVAELAYPSDWSHPGWSLACIPLVLHRKFVGILAAYVRLDSELDAGELVDTLESLGCLLAPLYQTLSASLEAGADGMSLRGPGQDDGGGGQHCMLGKSAEMQRVYAQIARVAPTNATVLVRGETGSGKELVANAIRVASPRASAELVRVNCAALPEALFESELFGYERGAFTGAHGRRKGRFEQAHGGTLFLDEIGELPLASQAKLLRVLQFREFERLGSPETVSVDVRVICATNCDLERAVAAGSFREDLYHRINVFAIDLPPLRARLGDIPLLAEHFVAHFCREHKKSALSLSADALAALSHYAFPGNVRELSNIIERAVVQCDGEEVGVYHLPSAFRSAIGGGRVGSLAKAVESLERKMLSEALERCDGIAARAAVALETTERVFRYKAQRYGISYVRTRP